LSAGKRSRWYRHLDAALVRATAHSGELVVGPWPESDDGVEIDRWCAWFAQAWAPVAEAVTVASPVLASSVAAACAGRRPSARQAQHMAMSLARYLARMRGRATPFGLFAGVAPVRFGQEPSARWTENHHARARADAVWLAGVIERLESCPALRHRLTVMVNDLVFVRGERLVVPWQPHASHRDRGTQMEVSVRHSEAVQTVMRSARSPIQVGDLLDKLATEIPGAAVGAIDAMLAELVARGVLITSLRPPSTTTDGLAHVLDQLQRVQASMLDEVTPLVAELRGIQARVEAANRLSSWLDGRARRAAVDRMRTVSDRVDQPLMVDLRLGCGVVLPSQVAAEAESAAGALLLLNPNPAGYPPLRNNHTSFLDRFGAGCLIPIEQLVDPMTGLGFPAHYRQPGQPATPAGISRRDERLLALAQQAALDGAREVVLDETALDDLAGDGAGMRPAAHGELCVEVCSPTMHALTEGAFTLVVNGVGRTALAMNGRFLDLLSDDDRERMIHRYGQLPGAVEGSLCAQLSFPPKYPRMENVARAPLVLPEVICLAEHRDGRGRIPVRDLAVTADTERLYVVSLSRRRVVEPTLANAAALHAVPPIARLLFEIPRARSATLTPFTWGAAACLPFLPRIRYGRSVLAPARWRISTSQLPGADAPWPVWRSAMTALRERLRLPVSVQVGTADRCLRLNLDEAMDLALLRAHFDSAGEAALVWEAPTVADHGWFAGRAHEIVIPLASTIPAVAAPAIMTSTGLRPLIGPGPAMLPGSTVLSARVYGHPEVFDTVLTAHLPALLSVWEDPPLWWFIRYRDPAPHLRLRLHLASRHDYGSAVIHLGAWAAGLRRRGLIGDLTLDTYHPEMTLYGSGAALRAAEAVFAADSAAVLAQLTVLAAAREMHPHALTAVSMVHLAVAMTGSLPAGMRWLIDHARTDPVVRCDRGVLRQAVNLADASGNRTAPHSTPGGPRIAAVWQARRETATAYAARLSTDATHPQLDQVLTSLLHLHHIRAHGTNTDSERRCRRLARAVALAWTARHDTTETGHG
jgi:thiopeptide-type bacteriocin biosynthesis protein